MSIMTTVRLKEPASDKLFKQTVIASGAEWRNHLDIDVQEGVMESENAWIRIYNYPESSLIAVELAGEPDAAKELSQKFISKASDSLSIASIEEEF